VYNTRRKGKSEEALNSGKRAFPAARFDPPIALLLVLMGGVIENEYEAPKNVRHTDCAGLQAI
jgi:hypothetical protein